MRNTSKTILEYNDSATLTIFTWIYRFVDCVQKDQERLSVTSATLNTVFDAFNISPRFAGFVSRQHMPGSATRFDQSTYKPRQHGRCKCSLYSRFHKIMNPDRHDRDVVLCRNTSELDPRRRDSSRSFSEGGRLETLLFMVQLRSFHREITCSRHGMATVDEKQLPIPLPGKTRFTVTAASNGHSCILCQTSSPENV